jgi:hypothetical protein
VVRVSDFGEYAELRSGIGEGPEGKAGLMDGPTREAAGAASDCKASTE